MSRTIKITLAISLIINLVGLGMLLGQGGSRCFKGKHGMHRHGKFTKGLFHELGEAAKTEHQEMKAKRDELFTILTAESFDADLYQIKLDEIGALHHAKMQRISQAIKEKAMTMSQEERIELAEEMKRFHRGKYKHRRH